MALRRRRRPTSPADAAVREAFEACLTWVELAKADLVAAVPAGRAPGRPVPDALLAFEDGLRRAREAAGAWRAPGTGELWEACRRGIERSLEGAERLRLEAPPMDYEALVTIIGDLIAPLEPFAAAERALLAR